MKTEPDTSSNRAMALWLLDRMDESAQFLGQLRAARHAGVSDMFDRPELITRHQKVLRKLTEDDSDEEPVDLPAALVAKLRALADRDLLSGPGQVIEAALALYIAKRPDLARELPPFAPMTPAAARAAIEAPGGSELEAYLAEAARDELAREREGQSRESD